MIRGLEVILGVTGSIAVYKAVYLCREMIRRGANVHVVMTKNAMNFVTPLTFQTVTGNPVTYDMFELLSGSEIGHISLADRAHITLVAPATANVIGKVANGLADDFLSTMIMATKVPVLFAPAMNSVMWKSPAVRSNIDRLTEAGYHFVAPGTGELACGVTGQGKMAEPQMIIESMEAVLTANDLAGTHVLVTAGPTLEPIDPVRFVSNHSSGKMGYALARAAVRRGAKVTLISGPTLLDDPVGAETIRVDTAQQMYEAVKQVSDSADIIIKAAAVCDWRPTSSAADKIKKDKAHLPALELESTIDILSDLGANKREGQTLVGFAAETENLEENARRKMRDKKLDLIVANDVTLSGAGFHSEQNAVHIITKGDRVIGVPLMHKDRVSDRVIDAVVKHRKGK